MACLLPNLRHYHRPQSLEEALALLGGGPGVMALGGGVSLGMIPRPHVQEVVALDGLCLDEIEPGGEVLRIGACVTLSRLASTLHGGTPSHRLLLQTVRRTATTPLRHLMTVGGVVAGMGPWSDLPVALLALGTLVELDGSTQVPLGTLRPGVLRGRIVTALEVPVGGIAAGWFVKVGRTATDLAMASAAVVRLATGELRVAVGGLVKPTRVERVEAVLQAGSRELPEVCKALEALVKPRPDPRAEASYRLSLASVCIVDCLERLEGMG